MMSRVPPAHKSGTAGQIVNRVEIKTLGDYIAQKEKQYKQETQDNLTEYERGYQDGYYDAIVDGANK